MIKGKKNEGGSWKREKGGFNSQRGIVCSTVERKTKKKGVCCILQVPRKKSTSQRNLREKGHL